MVSFTLQLHLPASQWWFTSCWQLSPLFQNPDLNRYFSKPHLLLKCSRRLQLTVSKLNDVTSSLSSSTRTDAFSSFLTFHPRKRQFFLWSNVQQNTAHGLDNIALLFPWIRTISTHGVNSPFLTFLLRLHVYLFPVASSYSKCHWSRKLSSLCPVCCAPPLPSAHQIPSYIVTEINFWQDRSEHVIFSL